MRRVPVFLNLIHGRCGSTLLMQMLASGKNVIIEDEYPYEKRFLSYFDKVGTAVGAPMDSNWSGDNVIDDKELRVGPLPYETSLFPRESISDAVRIRLFNMFFDLIIKQNELALDGFEQAFYPEKATQSARENYNRLFYCKNILLIRDPRDIFISIRDFNSKRGFKGFGWSGFESEIDFIDHICAGFSHFIDYFVAEAEGDRVIKCRYEDLILSPNIELSRLSQWLGTNLSLDTVYANKSIFNKHITSKNGRPASLRWKSEMAPHLLDRFDLMLGEKIGLAGYERYA